MVVSVCACGMLWVLRISQKKIQSLVLPFRMRKYAFNASKFKSGINVYDTETQFPCIICYHIFYVVATQ